MKQIVTYLTSAAGTILLWVWTLLRLTMDWVGRSTLGDDWKQLREDAMPDFLSWLFQTPWWVPGVLATALTGALIWLNRPIKGGGPAAFDSRRNSLETPPLETSAVFKNQVVQEDRENPKISLGVLWFMRGEPANDDLYVLYCDFIAEETVRIERVSVLFNCPGGNGSFELTRFDPPRILNSGERYRFALLHQRQSVGAFWGEPIPLTENAQLNGLSQGEKEGYISRKMHMDGPTNCRVVITSSAGTEVKRDFSILAAGHYKMLNILDDAKIEPYDPNRLILTSGTFLS